MRKRSASLQGASHDRKLKWYNLTPGNAETIKTMELDYVYRCHHLLFFVWVSSSNSVFFITFRNTLSIVAVLIE